MRSPYPTHRHAPDRARPVHQRPGAPQPVEATALESRLERIKWRLWHGDAGEALTRAERSPRMSPPWTVAIPG